MKNFVVLILFYCSLGFSNSTLQLGTGSLTPHFTSSKKNYCNQWNNTGIIANKTYYIRYLLGNIGLTYMQGNDSICSEIEGLFFHYIFSYGEIIDTGVTFGGYAYHQKNWDEHAKKTPSDIDAPAPVRTDYFGRDIVPMLALDVGIHIVRRNNWSVKINNLLTPIIFNHSLAFEYRF